MEQAIWMCGVVGISIDQFDGWFNGHPDQFGGDRNHQEDQKRRLNCWTHRQLTSDRVTLNKESKMYRIILAVFAAVCLSSAFELTYQPIGKIQPPTEPTVAPSGK